MLQKIIKFRIDRDFSSAYRGIAEIHGRIQFATKSHNSEFVYGIFAKTAALAVLVKELEEDLNKL